MNLHWRTLAVAAAVLTAVGVVCAVCLLDDGDPSTAPSVLRVRDEMREGRQALRNQEADELAALARDLRVLAKRYVEQGDKKKAQRAIGAAQELDKRILALQDDERGASSK